MKELTDAETYKIFEDHNNQIIEDQKKQDEKDYSVMQQVKLKVSNKHFKLIEEELKECACGGYFEIVEECEGEREIDSEKLEVYIDQTVNGGYTGDNFEGFVYIKLNDKEYLKSFYSM